MRILISGASGFIGSSLVAKLATADDQVIKLVRGRPVQGLDEFAGPADLAEIGKYRSWPKDVDVVVHLAAFNPARWNLSSSDLEKLHRVNVEGTAALAKRAAQEGVGKMIFLSSAFVQSRTYDVAVNESVILPQNAYAASKKEAEDVFWAHVAGGDMRGCVLRPVPVYGENSRGAFASLLRLARLPLPLPMAGIGGQHSLLAIDHLIDVIQLCAASQKANGQVFLVADEGPLALHEIVNALRKGWGRRPMTLSAPTVILKSLVGAIGKEDVWRRMAESFVVDTGHIQNVLGWRSPVTAEQKLCRMAAEGRL